MILLTDLTLTTETTAQEAVEKIGVVQQYFESKIPVLISFGVRILVALFVFYVGHQLISWFRRLIRRSMERANSDVGVRQFADSALKIGLHILLLVVIANMIGIESTSIAALVASGGVAIGLALQGSLSNLAGGILILILKPFVVGDYIIEDSSKNEGTVKEIQIFYTKLATIDNKTIVIPNGTLANNSLTNVTGSDYRQLDLKIGISYDADLKKAKEILTNLIQSDPDIEQEKSHNVFVDELSESSVVLGVRAWVKTENYMVTRWRILEEIKVTFDGNHIEIPYNQLTVHLNNKETNI